ncbi:MAG TPA: hypothetical protein VKV04_15040 [Verrucomicrobiae bacterium]|nr:hypothetical protein [Verrucomicrobiae bacterium]
MSSTVAYFGHDYCNLRRLVLEYSGFNVKYCGLSISTLMNELRSSPVEALLIDGESEEVVSQVLGLIHAQSSAPTVLFASTAESSAPGFDAAIPPYTLPGDWVRLIATAIEGAKNTGDLKVEKSKQSREPLRVNNVRKKAAAAAAGQPRALFARRSR